jgi:leucyl/phenylalanyl-tRNA--protein transferase
MEYSFEDIWKILTIDESLQFPEIPFSIDGIVAIGGDFNPYRLLYAYSEGIFPWPADGEIFWTKPEKRMLLYPKNFQYTKSFKQTIRNKGFEIKADTQFQNVMQACANMRGKDRNDTWILPEMIEAYTYLHKLGLAHSIEVYLQDELVGGLYGISLGAAFFGESMFSKVSNASKIALHFLAQQSMAWKFRFIDAQVYTEHLARLGAIEISNRKFESELKKALAKKTIQGLWTNKIDKSLFLI